MNIISFKDALKNNDIERIKVMISSGFDIDKLSTEGKSMLLLSTEHNNIEIVKLLLENGAKIDNHKVHLDNIERTPFLYAGANGMKPLLELFVNYNPDYSIVNYYGGSALIPACERGHIDTVIFLLENTGIDVNLINNLGWTALMETVLFGDDSEVYQQIVKKLILHGADISIADKNGITVLEHAIKRGHSEIVDIIKNTTYFLYRKNL